MSTPADKNTTTCYICLFEMGKARADGTIEYPETLDCGHTFGDDCLHEWIATHDRESCPYCRTNIHGIEDEDEDDMDDYDSDEDEPVFFIINRGADGGSEQGGDNATSAPDDLEEGEIVEDRVDVVDDQDPDPFFSGPRDDLDHRQFDDISDYEDSYFQSFEGTTEMREVRESTAFSSRASPNPLPEEYMMRGHDSTDEDLISMTSDNDEHGEEGTETIHVPGYGMIKVQETDWGTSEQDLTDEDEPTNNAALQGASDVPTNSNNNTIQHNYVYTTHNNASANNASPASPTDPNHPDHDRRVRFASLFRVMALGLYDFFVEENMSIVELEQLMADMSFPDELRPFAGYMMTVGHGLRNPAGEDNEVL